jgi:hypothetical protein
MEVRRIRPDEGPVLRAVRIAALTDTPSAFGAGVADTLALPDAEWAARARRGASGDEIWVTDGNAPAERVSATVGFRPTGERQPLPSDTTLTECRMELQLAFQEG